jgi:hypothetical protein
MAQRISVGIQYAPPLSLRLGDDELEKLRGALGGEGWHELEAEDGTFTLRLDSVLWLRVDKDEQRVGFGLKG